MNPDASRLRKTASRKRPPRRRTNAERTAQTRNKLIVAAIDSLYRAGYAATTTIEVARIARASRGAMLHHFPTRVDLLIAVAEHIVMEQRDYRRVHMAPHGAGSKRFFTAADVSWEIQKQPSTIALLEIMMASRSERDLRKRIKPLVQRMNRMREVAAERIAQDLGVADRDVMRDLLHVHLAGLRGLAIELMFTQDPEGIERARRLFTSYEHVFARALMEMQKS